MWWAVAAVLLLLGRACGGQLRDSVGSPGDLAWQAWLMVDPRTEPGPPQRRIMPKSVFIAPAFAPQELPKCAEGYRADTMGRCVKLVRVNQAAQLDFLLKRLNSLYATPPGERTEAPTMLGVAPPVNIPPIGNPIVSEDQLEVSVVMAEVKRSSNNNSSGEEEEDGSAESVISVWSLENDTVPKPENISHPLETSLDTVSTSEGEDLSEGPFTFKIPLPPPPEVLSPTDVEDSLPILFLSPQTYSSPQQNSSEDIKQSRDEVKLESVASVNSNLTDNFENNSRTNDENQTMLSESSEVVSLRLPLDTNSISNKTHDQVTEIIISEQSEPSDDFKNSVQSTTEYSATEEPQVNNTSDQATSATHILNSNDDLDHKRTIPIHNVVTSEKRPQGFVRFPSEFTETADNSHSIHIFSGNYVKFPTDEPQKFSKPSPNPMTPLPYAKHTLWWLPEGWRLDHQRHQPTLMRFWSRMPLRTDSARFSQQSPIPYRLHSSYAPNWP